MSNASASACKEQVHKFYTSIWNEHDKSIIPEILHPNVAFRGSLGQQHHKNGHEGVADYVDMIHRSLGHYQVHIEDMVAEHNKVFCRLRFSGIHRGQFMGFAPTLKRVSWGGCAVFTFDDTGCGSGDEQQGQPLVVDIWVLGDVKALEDQLKTNKSLLHK